MLGDTLRLELSPFGVQVVTVCAFSGFGTGSEAHIFQVITGTVNTTFFENQAKYLEVPKGKEQHTSL
jgi:hypothetical protein